jgi:hypothetical protein
MSRITVAVPCRADEPSLGLVVDQIMAGCRRAAFWGRAALELLVCVNGAERRKDARPIETFRERCRAHGLPLEETWLCGERTPAPAIAQRPLSARLFVTGVGGKARAWNLLRAAAAGDPVFVCDADVTFSEDAIALLYAGLAADPDLAFCTPKTDCRHDGGILERIVAAPYRFDFPNLSGQLYVMSSRLAPRRMPADVIEPERWLELETGPQRVGRDPRARVYVRLTATLPDFFRQRVRIELGKIQLRREYPHLLARSRPQPRFRAACSRPVREQAALAAYLGLRTVAHAWAWWEYRRRALETVWRQARTTKRWGAGAVGRVGGPS